MRTVLVTVALSVCVPAGTAGAHTADPSWEAVRNRVAICESGGRYDARNRHSTASGRYQFLRSTWAGRGGYRSAADAPPEMQEQAARELYAARGLRPWRASRGCWGRRR